MNQVRSAGLSLAFMDLGVEFMIYPDNYSNS